MSKNRRVVLAAALSAIASASAAQGAIATFVPASGFGLSYNSASNWSTAAIPGAGDTAILGPNTTGSSSVTLSASQAGALASLIYRDVNLLNTTVTLPLQSDSTGTNTKSLALESIQVDGTTFVTGTGTSQNRLTVALVSTGSNFSFTNNGAANVNTMLVSATSGTTPPAAFTNSTAGSTLTYAGSGQSEIAGNIVGFSGGLVKNGSGTMILSGPNASAFSAGTIGLNAGYLYLNSTTAAGAATSVTFNSGSTAVLAGNTTMARPIVLTGNGVVTGSSFTLTGGISGGGSLTKIGTNTVTIQAAGTNTGATTVEAGTLTLNTASGSLAGTSSVTLNSGVQGSPSTLQITSATSVINRVNDNASITFNGGTLQYQASSGGLNHVETFGNVTVNGFGRFNNTTGGTGSSLSFGTLTRADNFTTFGLGDTTYQDSPLSASTMQLLISGLAASGGSGQATNVIPWANNGNHFATVSPAGSITTLLNNNATYFNQASASLAAGVNNTVTASFANAGSVSIKSLVGNSFGASITGTGTVTVTDGAVNTPNSLTFNGPTLDFGSVIGFIHAGSALTLTGASTLTGSAGVVVSGSSSSGGLTLTTTNANTFTGGLYVNGVAPVSFQRDDQLGAAGESVALRGATLSLPSSLGTVTLATSSTNRPVTIGVAGQSSGVTIGRFAVNSSSTLIVPGVVSGTGSLVKDGAGTLTLSGANTYLGGTQLVAGTLSVSSDANLGTAPTSAAENLWMGGGTLQTTAPFTLNANRIVVLGARQATSGSTGTFDVAAGTRLVIGGAVTNPPIAGTGSLTKSTGTGTLVLAANSDFTGTTTVSAGTLIVNGTLTPGGLITATGATAVLGGSGVINRPVTLSSGATLSPGDGGVGTITIDGVISLGGSGNKLAVDVAPSSADLLVTRSTVALGSSTLAFVPTFTQPASSYTGALVKLIDTAGASSLTGTFSGVTFGTPITSGLYVYTLSSVSGDVFISVTAVPEPTTLGLIGAAGLLALRRRSR